MLYGWRDSRYRTYRYNNIIIRCCMDGEIVDIELIAIIILLYGRRDSRYRTYHYNNIIIRCCMEGEIVAIGEVCV